MCSNLHVHALDRSWDLISLLLPEKINDLCSFVLLNMHVLSMYFNFLQVNYLSLSVFLGSLLVLIIFYEMQINASVIFEYITDKQDSFTSNFNFIF